MVSEALFVALVLLVGVQRLLEVRHSKRNEARLRARGAREHAPGQLRWMKLLHGAWIAGMILEVVLLDRPFQWPLAAAALAVFLAGQALRIAAIRALGERWSVRILTVPGEPAVSTGIFRHLRHPNYLGVALELAALPLVHGAWITSLVASALNALVLRRRIAAEEEALQTDSGYAAALGDRPRFVPHGRAG